MDDRTQIAAMAMQGLITGCFSGNNAGFTVQGNVFAAVEYADALLAELGKEECKHRNRTDLRFGPMAYPDRHQIQFCSDCGAKL